MFAIKFLYDDGQTDTLYICDSMDKAIAVKRNICIADCLQNRYIIFTMIEAE